MRYLTRHFLTIAIGAALPFVAAMAQESGFGGDANREARAAIPSAPSAAAGSLPYSRITQEERFHDYVKHMFSAESVLRAAVGSGIDQAADAPHEWGQGAEGYGERFANCYGQHIVRSTLLYGSSAALHEDNRYFLSGESGFWRRFKYAVASTFLARRDDGSRGLSFSQIGSATASGFISREWQPPSTSGPAHAVSAIGTTFGVDVGLNVAREFFPKIFHTLAPVRP